MDSQLIKYFAQKPPAGLLSGSKMQMLSAPKKPAGRFSGKKYDFVCLKGPCESTFWLKLSWACFGHYPWHESLRWLAECFCREARSVDAALESKLKGALFTGRRTGDLGFMMVQGLYLQHAFSDVSLGASCVTARYNRMES